MVKRKKQRSFYLEIIYFETNILFTCKIMQQSLYQFGFLSKATNKDNFVYLAILAFFLDFAW